MNQVSDIKKVNKLSRMIYDKNVEPSTRKNKKYMIMNDDHKYIHFGDLRYEDYTKHQDKERLKNYLSIATKIKGNWRKDKYSPNNLAINLLWNNKWIFTFWSLIILQSQAAQATQQQTRPPKPNKRKSLNYSKMRGARPPNNSDRPFPTNDFRILRPIILKIFYDSTRLRQPVPLR